MLEIRVRFVKDGGLGFGEVQVKKFKDEISCIEWARRNHEKIFSINGWNTYGSHVGHFDIMNFIRYPNDI